jgi:cyanophycinase
MSNLIDNSHQQAIALAFTAAKDIVKPELGFEFKFRKNADSLGYYTGEFGGQDYTVENIYLDIMPIKINENLYEKMPSE